ncbi:hypothetical protein [Galactobacter caseinivorans]|nr:hypothetical protein [Galactobacter caseinivorans]
MAEIGGGPFYAWVASLYFVASVIAAMALVRVAPGAAVEMLDVALSLA